ncbi:cytochrome P450 [Actinomadura madurae]|nr:cytochrome P450 [Actinomadura madurae]MCQ0013088.1 cytochrome P450 [Actinomadura madurae]
MAPDTPVRASSPHRVRGAARGPSPSPSLTVRHGIGFAMNPCASLLRLYAEAGPVAAIGTRRKPFVHLFGPDANAFVFANSALFQWREAFDLLVPVNGETALIVSDGADHRRRRRLVQPAFHHRRVAGYVARMAANTDAALDSWRPGQTLDAYAELRAVIRRNTVEVLFGDRLAADAEVIGRRLQVALAAIDQNFVLQMMLRSVPNPYMRRVAASRDLVVRRVGEEVERREAEGGEHDDVLGMLLAARDEDGTGLTRQELQDQVISLISAGLRHHQRGDGVGGVRAAGASGGGRAGAAGGRRGGRRPPRGGRRPARAHLPGRRGERDAAAVPARRAQRPRPGRGLRVRRPPDPGGRDGVLLPVRHPPDAGGVAAGGTVPPGAVGPVLGPAPPHHPGDVPALRRRPAPLHRLHAGDDGAQDHAGVPAAPHPAAPGLARRHPHERDGHAAPRRPARAGPVTGRSRRPYRTARDRRSAMAVSRSRSSGGSRTSKSMSR